MPQETLLSDAALVVTSISAPNPVLRSLASGASHAGSRFIVVGDSKSPPDFQLDGCDYYSLAGQKNLPFSFSGVCPLRSYARKNIGYLIAIRAGAQCLVETDDDNFPYPKFWDNRQRALEGNVIDHPGWVNAYAFFTDKFIYPRGFPLDLALQKPAARDAKTVKLMCPIQQGLADDNPDVDAVYRMLYPLPFRFDQRPPVVFGSGTWCPFNSQNTTFWPEVFPLLYLPSHCSFRMTDIWRSFIAQRILWTCGWNLGFHSATVYQERNEHDLMRDFEEEIPGYLQNKRIVEMLEKLDLRPGPKEMAVNLRACYRSLVQIGAVGEAELPLLDCWLQDLATLDR